MADTPNDETTTETKKQKKWILPDVSRIVSYFRELSIVIIGVLATLAITSWINNYNRQKEICGMLTHVKEELQTNLLTLKNNQMRWEGEQRIFRLLLQHENEFDIIPVDTLSYYSYAIGALYHPSFIEDSYDLLKSSLYIQDFKDKELLRRLAVSYRELRNLSKQLSNYSDQKTAIFISPMIAKMNSDKAKIWSNNNSSEVFLFSLQEEGFNTFIYLGQTILSPTTIFEDNKKSLQEMIQTMDRAGY